jgi:hypothetical protein
VQSRRFLHGRRRAIACASRSPRTTQPAVGSPGDSERAGCGGEEFASPEVAMLRAASRVARRGARKAALQDPPMCDRVKFVTHERSRARAA